MSLATPIIQIIDRDPITIDVRQKLSEAAQLLSGQRFHHLPVVDGNRLVGILSATDMLRLDATSDSATHSAYLAALDASYEIEDIMQHDVITVSHLATIGDAARLLSAGGFHSVPVVDQHNHVLGVITTTDLVEHMLAAEPAREAPSAGSERLRALEQVLQAAQNYLHSGLASPEHQRLERAIEAARRLAA